MQVACSMPLLSLAWSIKNRSSLLLESSTCNCNHRQSTQTKWNMNKKCEKWMRNTSHNSISINMPIPLLVSTISLLSILFYLRDFLSFCLYYSWYRTLSSNSPASSIRTRICDIYVGTFFFISHLCFVSNSILLKMMFGRPVPSIPI